MSLGIDLFHNPSQLFLGRAAAFGSGWGNDFCKRYGLAFGDQALVRSATIKFVAL